MAKAAEKKAKVSRPRPKLDEKELKAACAELRKKYPHVIPNTLQNAEAGEGPHSNKRTVEIKCQHPGCKEKRRVATSDLAQVKFCEEHTRLARLERRRAARKEKSEAKKKAKSKRKPK